MKLIPSMGLYFPPLIKQAEGKSFPERCGGQRTPTPHHHVSSRRFKGREGPRSESCERCARGDTCTWCWPGDTTRNQPRSRFGSEERLEPGEPRLCPRAGPAAPHAALPQLRKSLSHPPPPSINFYNLLILRSVLKSKQLGGRNADSFS